LSVKQPALPSSGRCTVGAVEISPSMLHANLQLRHLFMGNRNNSFGYSSWRAMVYLAWIVPRPLTQNHTK